MVTNSLWDIIVAVYYKIINLKLKMIEKLSINAVSRFRFLGSD